MMCTTGCPSPGEVLGAHLEVLWDTLETSTMLAYPDLHPFTCILTFLPSLDKFHWNLLSSLGVLKSSFLNLG